MACLTRFCLISHTFKNPPHRIPTGQLDSSQSPHPAYTHTHRNLKLNGNLHTHVRPTNSQALHVLVTLYTQLAIILKASLVASLLSLLVREGIFVHLQNFSVSMTRGKWTPATVQDPPGLDWSDHAPLSFIKPN